jgi:probable F420-dependent oxidoreductase
MRLGIVTPVVNLNPRFSPPRWELEGGMDDIVAVARAAEDLGYGWVTCSEHVAIPVPVADARGGRYWDPAVTLSYVAASTSRIGLLTYVLVLGYHHPLEIVKRFGSLDEASGGRVVLGVGVGTLEAEFEMLGVPFADRGRRADEAVEAIRAAFGVRVPVFSGSYYSFSDVVVEPCGVSRQLQIWVGGRTHRSLRRALDLADGWIPFGLGAGELTSLLGEPELRGRIAERAEGFEIVLAPEPPLDPLRDTSGTRSTLRAYASMGATALNVRFRHDSRAHLVEQLEAMRDLTADETGT